MGDLICSKLQIIYFMRSNFTFHANRRWLRITEYNNLTVYLLGR